MQPEAGGLVDREPAAVLVDRATQYSVVAIAATAFMQQTSASIPGASAAGAEASALRATEMTASASVRRRRPG